MPGNLPRAAVGPAAMAAARLAVALLFLAAQVSATAGRLGRATRDCSRDLAVHSLLPPPISGRA